MILKSKNCHNQMKNNIQSLKINNKSNSISLNIQIKKNIFNKKLIKYRTKLKMNYNQRLHYYKKNTRKSNN